MGLLDIINTPEDLKRLTIPELETLGQEIRSFLIEKVSRTGGHLSSNLGTVELTIALLYVFSPPEDRIIFDVGHQCYTYKILTERKSGFDNLRGFGGLSGFPSRSESAYDVYGTGHASTSISSCLGIAEGLRMKGKDAKVIAVVGDGSLTGGLSFEGLNHAGDIEAGIIVVLNDNKFSISRSVGAVSRFLSRKMTGGVATGLRKELKGFLSSIFGLKGEKMIGIIRRLEDGLMGLMTPGILFEALNFHYIGPIEGHNIPLLIETFMGIRKLDYPVLVHALTTKGKGFPPAEENPAVFHGIGPFVHLKKEPNQREPETYSEIFGRTMIELAEKEEKLVAITAAMPGGTGLEEFQKRFPKRFYDVGIAEEHSLVFAAGLAVEGFIPVVTIYSTFLQRGFDQIIHDICLQNLHVIIAIDRAGIVGGDGPTHQGIFDLSFLRTIPNIVIMAPRDEAELRDMLYTAMTVEGPCAIRYPKAKVEGVDIDKPFRSIPIGKGEIVHEGGGEVLFLSFGNMVRRSVEAAHLLKKDGIPITVVDMRFVKPLDTELLKELIPSFKFIFTFEENLLMGGAGSAILESLSDLGLLSGVRVWRFGIGDCFVETGDAESLRAQHFLTPERIKEKVLRILDSTQ